MELHRWRMLTCRFAIVLFGTFILSEAGEETQPANWIKNISITKTSFENWAQTIVVPNVWIATPKSAEEVLAVVNWANNNQFKVRPTGSRHAWPPITVSPNDMTDKVILIDAKDHLNKMKITWKGEDYASVWTETGAELGNFFNFVEKYGYGLTASPVIGSITMGGLLAVDGHGHGIPAKGEKQLPGHTYGTLSNLIVSFQAVVWNYAKSEYVLETFNRSHPNASAFLTNLGRTILTDVTLRVGKIQNLRCESLTDIPASEIFSEDANRRTFASFLEKTGRVDLMVYPFTDLTWVKLFSVADTKPPTSRHVNSPYNYEFSETTQYARLKRNLAGNWSLTPQFYSSMHDSVKRGLAEIGSTDIWGTSKNVLLCMLPSAGKVNVIGYAILTERKNIQPVVARFYRFFTELLNSYREENRFPLNNVFEMRVTGLDKPEDILVPDAESPLLSAVRPTKDFPAFDVAIWMNIATSPGTPDAFECFGKIESFLLENFKPPFALFRSEWSKGWGFTDEANFNNRGTFDRVKSTYDGWDTAKSIFKYYDKNDVFYNAFHEKFLFGND